MALKRSGSGLVFILILLVGGFFAWRKFKPQILAFFKKKEVVNDVVSKTATEK